MISDRVVKASYRAAYRGDHPSALSVVIDPTRRVKSRRLIPSSANSSNQDRVQVALSRLHCFRHRRAAGASPETPTCRINDPQRTVPIAIMIWLMRLRSRADRICRVLGSLAVRSQRSPDQCAVNPRFAPMSRFSDA